MTYLKSKAIYTLTNLLNVLATLYFFNKDSLRVFKVKQQNSSLPASNCLISFNSFQKNIFARAQTHTQEIFTTTKAHNFPKPASKDNTVVNKVYMTYYRLIKQTSNTIKYDKY